MSMAWEPDRRSNYFFSPPAHLCAVTYMTEISLIVTLNNQFNPIHRHFVGFFNVPVQTPTRGHPFYTVYSEKRPHLIAFYDTPGIRRIHSRLNPPGPHRVMHANNEAFSTSKCSKVGARISYTTCTHRGFWPLSPIQFLVRTCKFISPQTKIRDNDWIRPVTW